MESSILRHARCVAAALHEPALILAADLTVLSASRAFLQMFRLTADAIDGRSLDEIPGGISDVPSVKPLLSGVLRDGNPVEDFRFHLDGEEGGRRTLLLSAHRIAPETGQGAGMILLELEDITETIRAKELAKRNEQRYQAIVQTALDGFWIFDSRGRFREVNNAYCEMIGYTREELLKMSISDLEAIESSEETARHIDKLARDGHDRFETRHRRKDGRLIDLEVSATHMPDDSGEFVSFLRDITERKKLERRLRSLSLTDHLTGLYNRRGFVTLARSELQIARRLGRDLLLLYGDVDGMKQINDTYGHAMGDAALVRVARILKRSFRKSDIVGRLGGDEFAVLGFATNDGDRCSPAARLREAMRNRGRKERLPFSVSMSVGVKQIPPGDTSSIEHLLAEADRRMYIDKKKRRKQEAV